MTCPTIIKYFASRIKLPRDVIEIIVIKFAEGCDYNYKIKKSMIFNWPHNRVADINLWEFGFIHGNINENLLIYVAITRPKLLVTRDRIYGDVGEIVIRYINCPETFSYFLRKFPTFEFSRWFLTDHARYGNFEIIKFACADLSHSKNLSNAKGLSRAKDFSQLKFAINSAAEAGNLEIIRYIYEMFFRNRSEFACTYEAIDNAAKHCLPIIKYIYENIFKPRIYSPIPDAYTVCTPSAISNAAWEGNLPVIRYIFQVIYKSGKYSKRNFGCYTFAMDAAVEKNHFKIVRYIHEKIYKPFGRTGCTKDTCNIAAQFGNMKIIRYLHERVYRPIGKTGFTKFSMESAARAGHLEVVKYLHTKVFLPAGKFGCDLMAFNRAAMNNHVDILRYIYENIYVGRRKKFNAHPALGYAALYGNYEAAEYIFENIYKLPKDFSCLQILLMDAHDGGHYKVADYIRSKSHM